MDGMAIVPLLTAIMPARGRPAMAAAAVECWRRQTWQNSELVIVDDMECPAFPEMAKASAQKPAVEPGAGLTPEATSIVSEAPEWQGIRYVALSDRLTIGAKRNIACAAATGEFILHADSDDWSAPTRLAEQMATLQKTGKQVAGFHSLLFTDGVNFWRYTGAVFGGHPFDAGEPGAFGTSLLYRKSWWGKHQFPYGPMNYANYEDRAFVAAAIADGAFVSVPAGEMMVARIHSDNTSPKSISGERWKPIQDASLLQQYRGLTG